MPKRAPRDATAYDLPVHASCPFCECDRTELLSPFGPQLSVATYWCYDCHTRVRLRQVVEARARRAVLTGRAYLPQVVVGQSNQSWAVQAPAGTDAIQPGSSCGYS